MPCPDEGSQGDSCARYDVRPRAWSWPSGFYSLLERCTISQNITVHADTSPHTRVGLQMLRNSWRRLSAPHLSDLELPHASWLKFVRPNSNFNISWLSWLHFPLVHFFFPKLRIEQSFPFSCIGLVGMPLATPIFSWNHFDRKGMSLFWLNSITESPCWLLWQLFFFQNVRPPSTHFGWPSVLLESVCYLRSTVSCPLAARWSLWFHRIIHELPTVALQLYL